MLAITRRTSVLPSLLALALGAATLLLLPAVAAADPFAGSFEGDGLWMELELEGDAYMGVIELGEQLFLCQARRGGPGLVGTFESDGQSFPFQVRAAGGRLVLTSGGTTYTLRRVGGGDVDPVPPAGGAPNPLAGGGREDGAAAPGGGAADPRPEGLSGRYQGSIQGTAAVMTLEQQGGRLSGRIDVSGYPYELQGTVSGVRASGQGRDLRTGGGFGFEATLSGDLLELVLLLQDPYGQPQRNPVTFRRTGATAPPGGDGGQPGGPGGSRGVPAGPRDPALVGLWRQSESMSGGGSSMVVETFLQINADGTWAMGGGRAVGGGAGWGGDTGTGGVQETGYWKSENRIVYVQSPGSGQWQPFARYYLEGGTLMFTFGDGSRQILHRVR